MQRLDIIKIKSRGEKSERERVRNDRRVEKWDERFLKIDFLILIRAIEEKKEKSWKSQKGCSIGVERVHNTYIPFRGVCVSRFKRCCVFDNPIRSTRIYLSLPLSRFLLSGISFVPRTKASFADRDRERERMAMKKKKQRKAPAMYKSPEVPKII